MTSKKKIIRGFTAGAWDLLHAGHVTFLIQAKAECDQLCVGLHYNPALENDDKNKPIQSVYERFIQLAGCTAVDRIIPYETEDDLINILATGNFKKRFLGSDYEQTVYGAPTITGRDLCVRRNIELVFLPRLHNYSSTELRARIKANG